LKGCSSTTTHSNPIKHNWVGISLGAKFFSLVN
jgi:hypothetical protein